MILEPSAAEVPRPHAEDKADGVYEVRLARAVRPHDAGELLEGPHGDAAFVGLT